MNNEQEASVVTSKLLVMDDDDAQRVSTMDQMFESLASRTKPSSKTLLNVSSPVCMVLALTCDDTCTLTEPFAQCRAQLADTVLHHTMTHMQLSVLFGVATEPHGTNYTQPETPGTALWISSSHMQNKYTSIPSFTFTTAHLTLMITQQHNWLTTTHMPHTRQSHSPTTTFNQQH